MVRAPRALAVVLLFACARPKPVSDGVVDSGAVPPARSDGRLPRQVHPARYALDFVVDPALPRFSGRATVDVIVDEPTRAIAMNARGLVVRAAALVVAG